MNQTSQVPMAVAAYFGVHAGSTGQAGSEGSRSHPIVAEEFHPDLGWVPMARFRKRITMSWARKLQSEGVTHVALSFNGRRADFSIKEILSDKANL